MVSQTEWTFYPNFGQPRTFHVGKRCLLEGGHHYRTIRCSSERTLEATIGRKKQARKRMEDREADILEVKKLSKWRPAPVIFKTVLDN
ncbi:unnamed protein product [Coregonus sp. 'balchen']|nr:unnamed protein product [Coregonus sp. 'balchen']